MTVTVLTGATGGIGRALAHRLADHQLVLVGRSRASLDALAAELRSAQSLQLDLANVPSLAAALADAGLEQVDALVHCAGIADLGTVEQTSAATWAETMTVNALAPAELTRLLLPQLRAARGAVVFVNSGAGKVVNAGWTAYAASKFALRALADGLREEEAQHGIRVTTVFPGRTATRMQQHVRTQEGGDYDPSAYARAASVAETIALALELPRDAAITELSVRPGPRA